jgi:hypothetical protein
MKIYTLEEALQIVDRLRDIPHLKLASGIDVENVILEMQNAVRWDPFKLRKFDDGKVTEVIFQKLPLEVAEGLIDVTDDGRESNYQISIEQTKKNFNELTDYRVNEFGKKCPTTISLIKKYVEYATKCKFSRLKSHEPVQDWHSHSYVGGNIRNFSLHWPLITNDNVKVAVRKEKGSKEIFQHYAKGELWLLNTWWDHMVINEGPTDRYHLWGAANLYATSPTAHSHNHRLLSVIEQALDSYNGPYL